MKRILLFLFLALPILGSSQVLPWDPDPDCNSITTTGIVAVTCGTTYDFPAGDRYTFGMINLNGALPAAGRIDVSGAQSMYHHPAWQVDSLGNVFGVTMDNLGNTYVSASSNYSSDFFFYESVIRYGDIGGGPESLEAAGTIYMLDAATGQPTVFSVLPQQAYNFTNSTCEGFNSVDRFTGPGLGNLVFHTDLELFYVTNFEDGRIYRVDLLGNILDSYDPMGYDDGAPGISLLGELAYGVDISDDGTQLFFGTVGIEGNPTYNASIYSIDLQPDGSFTGTIDNSIMPVGATWDNYVGSEMLHISLPTLNAFVDVSAIADIEFTPSGDILVGNRVGCFTSIHNSYNHGGRALVVSQSGGVYNTLVGSIYTSNGVIDDENAYGGVSVFENPAGTTEYVLSSADMISEEGPHGICTQEENVFGSPFAPASPAGVISYAGTSPLGDAKGIGGDVFVFKACILSGCPIAIEGSDIVTCSNESFSLDFDISGGTADDVEVTWTDLSGMEIDPTDLSIENNDCAPALIQYVVTAVCIEDTTVMLQDTVNVTVITDDISPFITIIEEPCFIDIVIDSACTEFLTIVGDIPVINPGDVGSVTVEIMQTTKMSCSILEVTLNYNCACSISDLVATPGDCEDGFFMVSLDFDAQNNTDQFQVTDQDGTDLGTFNYADLPVLVGPFLGDPTMVYTLNVQDLGLTDCMASLDFGPVNCAVACGAGNEGPICEGATLQLFENGGDAEFWSWSSDGNALINAPDSQTPTATNVINGEIFTVTITSATGLTETCTTVATVFELPVCNADTDGPICEGGMLQLMENGGEAVSWSWSSDGGAVISDPTAQNPTATSVANGESFTVEITDANGCVSSCTVSAVVNDPPVCNAETDGAICEGGTLQLMENGGEAVSWFWSSDGGAVISDPTTQNPTATNVTDGETFTVEITDANGCISNCSVSAIVNELPVCNAINDGPICEGGTLQLSEDGGDATGWSWSSDGGAVISDPTAQNPTATNVSDGETFTVVVTDANGCESTCTTTAEVFDLPVCNASNDGPICAGDPLSLMEDGGDAIAWSWSSDGSAIINATSDQYPVATNVSDGEVFTVEITDENGCVSTCTTVAEVFDAPEVSASNNGPICEGDILILEANVQGGSPPFSYLWSHDNGFSSSNQTVFIQMTTQDDAGTYSLEVIDANGCTSSASTDVTINLNLTYPGEIAADEYFCGPGYDPALIYEVAPPSGAPGPIEFFWMQMVEGGEWEIIPGATGATYNPGPIYVTTKYSRCVRIDGCISALESNVVTKTVGDEAIANPMGPTGVCLGDEAFYFVVPTPGATYLWDFGSGATASSTTNSWATVSWATVGFHTITITVSTASCTATNYLDVIVTNSPVYCGSIPNPQPSITDQVVLSKMTIYPNPFEEEVTVRFSEETRAQGLVSVSDLNGRIIQTIKVSPGTREIELNLSDLPGGIYFIRLEQPGEQAYYEKIIKR
ncbi:MAG: T9SS type A sorting domain-containing protein [Saprospiraceae bacterium]|nr:T9SS type A sorting domain-containing protein [Saprospiraceae bacterium]